MNSSALLEETTQLEMDNPRKEQEELNLNELNSFLNSIMNKCRSKFFYYRQMQMLIGNTEDAMKEISNLKYFHAMSRNVKLPQMVGRLSLREPDGVMAL